MKTQKKSTKTATKRATKRTAVSAYQERIQKKLASLSIGIDPQTIVSLKIRAANGNPIDKTMLGNSEWDVVRMHRGHRQCELCGHNPILNIFTIQSKTTKKKLEIGSECATNYMDADLIAGLCKMYNMEYNKLVNPIKFEDELEVLGWANQNFHSLRNVMFVRNEMWRYVNAANPASVITKINGGKVIGKNEKAVIEFWSTIKKNYGKIEMAQAVGGFFAHVRDLVKNREYEERMAEYRRQQGMRGLGRFLCNLEYYNRDLENKAAVAVMNALASVGAFARIVEENAANAVGAFLIEVGKAARQRELETRYTNTVAKGELSELFDKVYNSKPNYGTKKFVDSLYSFYKRFGKLSDKQLAALKKMSGATPAKTEVAPF